MDASAQPYTHKTGNAMSRSDSGPGGTVARNPGATTGSGGCHDSAAYEEKSMDKSEFRGRYVARMNGTRVESGFDARLVMKQRQASEL